MLLWIPLLPFIGFLINNFGARKLPEKAIGAIASLAMLAAFGVSVVAVSQLSSLPAEGREIRRRSTRGLDPQISRCRSVCGSTRCRR